MAKQTFTAGQTLTAAQMNDLQTNDFNWSVSTQTANYTLEAADKGTREVMNMSSAGTVTVPNSTFSAGDIVWVHSIGSGTISIVAGSGMTLNSAAGTAPTLAQWEGGVVYFTSASSSIFFRGGGVAPANFSDAATGTYSSGGVSYKYITFNASSTITITRAGFADILVIGGGGSGGGSGGSDSGFGGGGAGGYLAVTDAYLPVGTLTVTIGAGGAGASAAQGADGGASRLGSFYALGGGAGYGKNGGARSGGSGGGGWNGSAGATGMGGLGNDGGSGSAAAGNYGGGGGGGASAAGANGTGTTGGNGGAGTSSSLDNVPTTRGGGGGGGTYNGGTAGNGGTGGGGAGRSNNTAGGNGSANTGGGGGSTGGISPAGGNVAGGNGGSGIVIVRVKT